MLLKYLINFWRAPGIPLIICEIHFILTWSEDCFISSATGTTKFKKTDEKNDFPYRLLLTKAQVSKLRKAFASSSWTNIKWSKTQLHKIGQSRVDF